MNAYGSAYGPTDMKIDRVFFFPVRKFETNTLTNELKAKID